MNYHIYAFEELFETLFKQLDDRFLTLNQMGWNSFVDYSEEEIIVEKIEDETLKKAAEWVIGHGYDSIDSMIGHMIFTAETVLGLDAEQLYWRAVADVDVDTIEIDGYKMPAITIFGKRLKGHENAIYNYYSEHFIPWVKFPAAVSKDCFAAAAGQPFSCVDITVNLITGKLTYKFYK